MASNRYSKIVFCLITPLILFSAVSPVKAFEILYRDFASYDETGAPLLKAFRWDEIEPEAGRYDWAEVDTFLTHAGSPLYVELELASQWATGGELRYPDDLNFDARLNEAIPDSGYSKSLYSFVYVLAEHMQQTRRLRYEYNYVLGHRPELTWDLSGSPDHRIDSYLRCLRTVHKALKDFRARNGRETYYHHYSSWGEIEATPLLEEKWFRMGQADANLRDSLLTFEVALHERDSIHIDTWEGLEERVGSTEVVTAIEWARALLQDSLISDFGNFRYTFKPYFAQEVLALLDSISSGAGLEAESWVSTTCALELQPGSLTAYSPTLHAGDQIRRWLSATWHTYYFEGHNIHVFNKVDALVTPMHGKPEGEVFGLRDIDAGDNEVSLAVETYRWSGLLDMTIDSAYGNVKLHRAIFEAYDTDSWCFDYLYLDMPMDGSTDTVEFELHLPAYLDNRNEDHPYVRILSGWCSVKLVNLYGDTLATIAEDIWDEDTVLRVRVTAEPVQIVWTTYSGSVQDQPTNTPASFSINAAYPNPFNSSFTVDYTIAAPGDATISLIGLDGREVMRRELFVTVPGKHKETFALSNLPSGEYIVRLSRSGVVESRRIVLLR